MGCYGTGESSWCNALHPLVLSYTKNPPPLGCALLLINTQLNARQHAFTLCDQLKVPIPYLRCCSAWLSPLEIHFMRNTLQKYTFVQVVMTCQHGCFHIPVASHRPTGGSSPTKAISRGGLLCILVYTNTNKNTNTNTKTATSPQGDPRQERPFQGGDSCAGAFQAQKLLYIVDCRHYVETNTKSLVLIRG